MYEEITSGLRVDPSSYLEAVFDEGHDELVMIRDIPLYSLCVPSMQMVNAVEGQKAARDVRAGVTRPGLAWTRQDDAPASSSRKTG